MKDTGKGNHDTRRKVYHCNNCGRIQSYTNYICESCGIDLGLYGTVKFVYSDEAGQSPQDLRRRREEDIRKKAEAEKKRQEEAQYRAEEERRRAEEERRRAEEERRRADEERRRAEEERRRADEERRRADEEHRRAEAEHRRQKQRKLAEEATKKAEEERRQAAEKKRLEQEAAQLKRKLQQEEAAKKQAEAEEKRRQERQARRKEHHRTEADVKKPSEEKRSVGFRKSFGIAMGAVLTVLVLLMIIGFRSQTCGDGLKWSFDEATATLTIHGTGTMDHFTSTGNPDRPNDYPERKEAPWMEDHREAIEHVVIESGAMNIGDCAFADCVNLTDVVIPETVKDIGQFSFANTAMVTVTIPSFVENISYCAFAEISPLRNFIFAGETPALSERIFLDEDERLVIVGNDNMAKSYAEGWHIVYVPGSMLNSNGDFGGDSDDGKLHWSINLYDRTMTITGSGPMEDFNGKWMLDNEDNMESWVEGRKFPYWTDYTRIVEEAVVAEGITRIGDSAFEQCYYMQKISLPNTLEYIGFQSFLCAGILRIEIPEGVTQIRDHAFNFCADLMRVELPESLERLQNGTFNMCNKMIALFVGENTAVEERTDDGCYSVFSNHDNPNGRPAHLTIHGKMGSEAHAFAEAENFKFREMGLKAGFEDRDQCGDNTYWRFVGDERTLYIEGKGDTWSYYITQNDIDVWADDLYRRNQTREDLPGFLDYAKYIQHIVVKPGVTGLGHNLFSAHDDPRLSNLQTVDFGTVKLIQANLKRTRLKDVEIPKTVVGIDGCALADNDHLRTVIIRNGSEWIGVGLLYNCPLLERVELHGKECIEDHMEGGLFNIIGDLPVVETSSDLTLYVTPGSEGEKMAQRLGLSYVYLD